MQPCARAPGHGPTSNATTISSTREISGLVAGKRTVLVAFIASSYGFPNADNCRWGLYLPHCVADTQFVNAANDIAQAQVPTDARVEVGRTIYASSLPIVQ